MTFLDEQAMAAAEAAQQAVAELEITATPNLHAVATSGDYNDLTNKPVIPTIPTLPTIRAQVVPTGALTSNTVKNVTCTFGTAMPSVTYTVTATPVTTSPHTVTVSLVSQTAAACVLAVRSTAAVAAGINLHVQAIA